MPILTARNFTAEPPNYNAFEIAQLAKCIAAGGGDGEAAIRYGKAMSVTPRVAGILKAPAITTGGNPGSTLIDWQIAAATWFRSLAPQSIFFTLLVSGISLPLRTKIGLFTANASAWIVGKGKPTPITSVIVDPSGLLPTVAAAMVVMSNEVARDMSTAATNTLNAELRRAVTEAVDEEFFNIVMPDPTAIITSSSGNDADAMKADLKFMLDIVNVNAGPLFLALAPDVANGAALLDDRGTMTPTGGELAGIPAVVTAAVPAGTARLLDASSIVVAAEDVQLRASNAADIEMVDNPVQNAATPTAAQLVSMFQTDSTALHCHVSFAAQRLRPSAIAEVNGISWGTP